MSNKIRIIKQWISAKIRRFKTWVIGILISLGMIGSLALAAFGSASWTNPTLNTDGSAFNAATEQQEVRLYCDVSPVGFVQQKPADAAGPAMASSATPDHVSPGSATAAQWSHSPAGTFDCFATVLSVFGYESAPSNIAAITFTPTVAPEAITDFGDAS